MEKKTVFLGANLLKKCGNKFSANHLWRVEDGLVNNPGIEMMREIAKSLNVKIDNLID